MSAHKINETIHTARSFNALSGLEKAAIILLILGEERSAALMEQMDQNDLISVTRSMAAIGKVPPYLVKEACDTFAAKMIEGEVMIGSLSTVERILKKAMGDDEIANIMNELKAPAGKTTWEKLSNINPDTISNFLESEGPQTAAVVISRLPTDYAAKVVETLDEDFTQEVMERILDLESVPRDTLNDIEEALQSEFMATLGRGAAVGSDASVVLAEIFNRTSSDFTDKALTELAKKRPEEVTTIQNRMFTFNDIANLDSITTDRIISSVDIPVVSTALKGASDSLIDHIVSAAGQRRGNLIVDELSMLGSTRRKDVKAAQNEILKMAKKLEAEGQITLKVENEDDQLID